MMNYFLFSILHPPILLYNYIIQNLNNQSQHSISLLTVAYISVVLCIDSIGKIRIWSIDSKERNEQNYFYGETLNKFSGERKINYLRI